MARQVGVAAAELGFYDWSGRQIKAHRAEIRAFLGYRECSVGDADKLTAYLAEHVCQAERHPERVRDELHARCRTEGIEPPAKARIDRIVASALHRAEQVLVARVSARLSSASAARIEALAGVDDGDDEHTGEESTEDDTAGPAVLAKIKADPGNVSLDTLLTEIDKLQAVRAIGLPAGLFADVAPAVVAAWRSRAAVESPSHLRAHDSSLRLTLLAALVHTREREITDTLVELLIATVHRIGARAERKVTQELVNAFKRVTGTENILFSVAEAALDAPDHSVREVVYPAVTGGEATLRDLVREYKTKGPMYIRTVHTNLKASYTRHYRRGMLRLLEVLEFRSNNTTHAPVIEALDLITRHAGAGTQYYPRGEYVPTHVGIRGDWAELTYRSDKRGRTRVVRTVYEVATFQTLREALKCKEIWVAGADKWRNPDEDLPADFENRREEHYTKLGKPFDPSEFVNGLRDELRSELTALDQEVSTLPWLDIADRKAGAIRLSPLQAAPEPRNLVRLKNEVWRRWGTVALIDMLKEAALRTGCLRQFPGVGTRTEIPPEILAERIILALYAYGTNTGIRSVAQGDHGHSEHDIRYARKRFLTLDGARAIAAAIADATLAARRTGLWGSGSTAVASDSTHVRV